MEASLETSPAIPWNGRFTIENTATGQHRTFQIKTQPDDAKFAPGKRVIALLTGPSNEDNYTGFGFVNGATGVQVWKKHRAPAGEPTTRFQQYADLINFLVGGITIHRNWDLSKHAVHIERRCRVCNRTLTTPESVESGIGPICAGRG